MSSTRLIALAAQPPVVDAVEAERTALELYGLTARAEPLDGERDRNFRLDVSDGRQFILKLIDPEADDIIVAGQNAALAHLAEQAPGVPVPRVVSTLASGDMGRIETRSGTYRVRVVTYLAGTLASRVKPTAALLHSVGAQAARLDHGLRGFFHPALGQPIAWDIRRAQLLLPCLKDVASPSARQLVSSALESLPELLVRLHGLHSQAIHGDCHARNLLVSDSRDACTGIIDLGDMIHAPLVLEPAVSMAEFLADGAVSVDALGEILSGYASVQALESSDLDVLYELIAARLAIAVLIRAWRSHDRVTQSEPPEIGALDRLLRRGKVALDSHWREAARVLPATARVPGIETSPSTIAVTATSSAASMIPRAASGPSEDDLGLLRRRHRTLGAHAELSYERPLHLVRGKGVWVYTAQGERLLDVYNNVPHVGHAHPVVVAAISEQVSRIASNTRYLDERIITYVERLTSTLPRELDTCLFVNSGSEANDIAWRIAKSHTGHAGAVVMSHAYHGITDAVNALSPSICSPSPPHVEQVAVPTNSATATADVDRALAQLGARGFKPAALLIDSALTSSGIFDPPPDWMAPIAAAVRAAGGVVIGDEVQFGLGRSGSHFWGFARRGYEPDIVTLGKPVGNGYPMGVVVTRRVILEKFQKQTGLFSTFGGNPVAGAAGLAVLEVLDNEQLMRNAHTTGEYFRSRLQALPAEHPALREVRGCGLMIGIEVAERPNAPAAPLTKRIVNGLRMRGVLIGSEGPRGNVLKLRPPMPFLPEHADIVAEALRAVLRDVH